MIIAGIVYCNPVRFDIQRIYSGGKIRTELPGFKLIMALVCNELGVSGDQMTNSLRSRAYVSDAKFIAMTLIRRHYPFMTLYRIAELFNNDHSNVSYGLKVINNALDVKDPKIVDKYQRCSDLVKTYGGR